MIKLAFKRKLNGTMIRSIRNGLISIMPILMVGSFALILRSLPIEIYQSFIKTFLSGAFYDIFNAVYSATFGMISIYMSFALGYSVINEYGGECENRLGAPTASVVSFLISVGFLTDGFESSCLSAVGMFTAIISSVAASRLYILISRRFGGFRLYSDGADSKFNRSVTAIAPVAFVAVIFALINVTISLLTPQTCFFGLTNAMFAKLFEHLGSNFLGAFFYVLLSSIMWIFGIHGSDVLESVNIGIFAPAVEENAAAVAAGGVPVHIFTKTFFDVFVLIGGCGTLLSLLIALLLFSRRKSNRSVAKMAAFPMLFNINEIMVFGLPIIYNPVMAVPFICAPLASFFISAAATAGGMVPMTVCSVEWTTPIILGGYQATGSVAGSVLQLVNVAVGVLIYMPFVKMYDREKERLARENIGKLVDKLIKCEQERQPVTLTELGGIEGEIAKQLVNDLRIAIERHELRMFYQPQCDKSGNLTGCEALLRWQHPLFGYVYPPLIIKLAQETGGLSELEKHIFEMVKSDIGRTDIKCHVSVNITPYSVADDSFVKWLCDMFPDGTCRNSRICIEVTEQSALITGTHMTQILKALSENGFLLAIDDFSMGFTSLKYLSDNHFDVVKLDGSLVRGLDNPRNCDIVASIVYLSQSLNFSVLAEYVETEAQRNRLEGIGCLQYQGYLYSKPLCLAEFSDYAANSSEPENTDINNGKR